MSKLPEHQTYISLNKQLTILGVERQLFFGALIIGAATFNFFSSLVGGVVMFALLYSVARYFTTRDPQMLHILINAVRFKDRYDAAKREDYDVKVVRHG